MGVILFLFKFLILEVFLSSCESTNSTWNWSNCDKSFLGITRPETFILEGFVEIIDKPLFGPALYFREDLSMCEWKFAIPLYHSISSLTYNKEYFKFVRDDDSFVENTWYQIADYNLIGGFLYWIELVEQQVIECDQNVRFPQFNPQNQWSLADTSRNVVNHSLCELDLDVSFVEKRIDLSIGDMKEHGLQAYEKLYEKFKDRWSAKSIQDKAKAWITWEKKHSSLHLTSGIKALSSTVWSNTLLLTNENFHVFDSTQDIGQYLSSALFFYHDVFYYVLLDFDGEIFLQRDDFKIKIGLLPHPMKQIFSLRNKIFAGINFQNELYYSEDYVSEVIIPQIECDVNFNFVSSGICSFSASLFLPFTTLEADQKCAEDNATYVTSQEKTYRTNTSSIFDDDVWHTLNDQEYYFSSNQINWDASVLECAKRQSKLATPKTTEIIEFYIDQGITLLVGYSIGFTRTSEYEFSWSDDTDVGATDLSWQKGEPNNYGEENCGVIALPEGLNDFSCTETRNYICQRQGLLFTEDNWLKSLHTSYEYSMQFVSGNFNDHEQNCQSLNGHLAYTGVFEDDSYNYIKENLFGDFTFYLGITNIGANDFVSLDLKRRYPNHFAPSEPNFPNSEHCVVYYKHHKAWADITCSFLAAGLCQRLEEQCDVAVESRVQCHPDIPLNASKSECIKNGCCYLEPIGGDFLCYKKFKNETALVEQNWFTITGSNYEYALFDMGQIGMTGARFKCREHGGDLAFKDLLTEDNFKKVWNQIQNNTLASELTWIGFKKDLVSQAPVSVNGNVSWADYYNDNCGDCTVLEIGSGKWLSTACESGLLKTRALCQRLIGINDKEANKAETFKCEKKFDYCAKYGASQCGSHSTCVNYPTNYECICNEGYTKKAGNCERFYECQNDWIAADGRCFLIQSSTDLSFYESELECRSLGSHLLTINSYEDLEILQENLYTNEQVWLGHRRTVTTGACIGLSGSNCEYIKSKQIEVETEFISECLKFNQVQSKFTWAPCHLSMKTISGLSSAYICEYDAQGKDYFSVDMMSYSYDVYPGWRNLKINNKDFLNDLQNSIESTVGLTLLATFDKFGNFLYKHFVNASGSENDFENFRNLEITKESVLYFAIIHDQNVLPTAWSDFTKNLNKKISDFPVDDIHFTVESRVIQNIGFDSNMLNEGETLFKCGDCIFGCSGTEVYLTDSENIGCRVYLLNNAVSYEYEIIVLKWEDKIHKKDVTFRSQILKEEGNFSLNCPKSTIDILDMGVNIHRLSTTDDEISHRSSINCSSPPCVHQIACMRPGKLNTQDLGVASRLLFCQKDSLTKAWTCPINKHNGHYQGHLEAQFNVSVVQKESFLATFDDLLHLGSPSIEFQTTLQYPIWAPALWKWKNFKYASLVQGIKGYAMRFSNQEVTTKIDFCLSCVPGFTLSFWIKVIEVTSNNNKIILITGKDPQSGDTNYLDELGVYMNANNKSLTAFVRFNGSIWLNDYIPFQIQKWTFLIVSWNQQNGLLVTIDSYAKPVVSTSQVYNQISHPDIHNIVTIRRISSMSIGSNQTNREIFDIDQLTMFYEKLNFAGLMSKLGTTFPLRYRFIEKETVYNSTEHPGINPLFHAENQNYPFSCPGSIINCKQGFTIAFTLKIDSDTLLNKVNSKDHILLLGNTPNTNMWNEKAKVTKTRGFSIQLIEITKNIGTISLRHTLSNDFTYTDDLKWEFQFDEPTMFWAQMDVDGQVLFCMRWPDNCKQLITQNTISNIHNEVDSYTTLNIGPFLLRFSEPYNVVTETIESVYLYNVWFLEQSLDLLMFADETHQLSSPIYFQSDFPFDFATKNGIQFEAKGSLNGQSIPQYNQEYGQIVFFLYNQWSSIMDSEGIEAHTTFLELSSQNFKATMPCLFDLENCVDGFTIHFSMLPQACQYKVSGNYCYILSTGAKLSAVSQGLAFYINSDNEYFYLDLSTKKRKWKINVKVENYETMLGVYRISWSPSTGLSFMVNDIVIARVTKWQKVTQIPNNFDPFTTFTIGKINSGLAGYYTLKLVDLYYWDGIVEALQTSTIGECSNGWYQIGENCFMQKEESIQDEHTQRKCRDILGYLPTISSFAAYQSISQNYLDLSFYIGLVNSTGKYYWENNKLPIEATSFNIRESNSKLLKVINTYEYERTELKWVPKVDSAQSLLCMTSIFKDKYFEGCYAQDNTFQTNVIRVHDRTSLPDNSYMNALGTYTKHQACRKACQETYESEFIYMVANQCNCVDKLVDTNQISSLTKLSKIECVDYDKLMSDSISSYSYLNYPFGSRDSFVNNAKDNCGAMDGGGLFKCGVSDDDKASLFLSNHFPIEESVPHNPLTDFTYELQTEVRVERYGNFQFKISSLSCCLEDICECNDDIYIKVDYQDGNLYEDQLDYDSLIDKEFEHNYENNGVYEVNIQLINFKDWINKTFKVTVFGHLDPVLLHYVTISSVERGSLAAVTAVALSGNYFNCEFSYGDNTPVERVYKLQNLNLPVTYHKYETEGYYEVTVKCWNRLGENSVTAFVTVETIITNIALDPSYVISYGDHFVLNWNLTSGSNAICNVHFTNLSLTHVQSQSNLIDFNGTFYFDTNVNTGVANISSSLYQSGDNTCLNSTDATVYTLVVSCYNALTDPLSFKIAYLQVEVPISGFSGRIKDNKEFFRINETFCIQTEILEGSNLLMVWNVANMKEKYVVEQCGEDECFKREMCSSFHKQGNYSVLVQVINALGNETLLFYIFYEIPISGLQLSIEPSILPLFPTIFQLLHLPKYPDGFADVDFHDNEKLKIVLNFNVMTHQITLSHRYSSIGYYQAHIHAYNNVSSFDIFQTFQVGINISDVSFSLVSSRFLRTKLDRVLLHINVQKGSELNYFLDFGDNTNPSYASFSENVTRTSPIFPDFHVVSHKYQQPGNYTISVRVSNIFGEISQILPEIIIVQNPLTEGEFRLFGTNISEIALPTGLAKFIAVLKPNLPTGYANNVHSKWSYLSSEGAGIFLTAYSEHEIDLFPIYYTFEYESIGIVFVQCDLWNIVSNLTIFYQFDLVEVVGTIVLDVDYLEIGLTNVRDTEVINASAQESITFKVSVLSGSHITYELQFGDNQTLSKNTPVLLGKKIYIEFQHSYSTFGIYTPTIIARNAVSNQELVLNNLVQIFEPVLELKMDISYIDIDRKRTGIDVFEQSSELYSLVYGKPAIISNSIQYLPLNRLILLKSSLLHGSNVSVDWYFDKVDIDLKIDEHDVVYKDNRIIESKSIIRDDFKLKVFEKLTETELQFIGEDARQNYDVNNYNKQSSILFQYTKPGFYEVQTSMHNPISQENVKINYEVLAEVGSISFLSLEPPIANKTLNISFVFDQIGTSSCYIVNLGDGSKIISFGLSTSYCLTHQQINSDNFHLLQEDVKDFKGKNVLTYSVFGNIYSGIGSLNITIPHQYVKTGLVKVEVSGFNILSQSSSFINLAVTEILCDYPLVSLEKNKGNSITKPRKVFSFLEFRIYSLIRVFCKLTSITEISWLSFSMFSKEKINLNSGGTESQVKYDVLPFTLQKFESPFYNYKFQPGLQFTSNSEDIAIQPRFLQLGLHLVCINVAMFQVVGVNSSDCIYIQITLPPLVAGIQYGVRRAVGFDEVINMNAAVASFDPDKETLEMVSTNGNQISNLTFIWSCPILVDKDFNENSEEAAIMFEPVPGLVSNIICGSTNLFCSNSLRGLKISEVFFTNQSINSNRTFVQEIQQKLFKICEGKNSCNITLFDWIKKLTNESDYFCLNITYNCDIIGELSYKYVTSNTSCVTSGYYPSQTNLSCEVLNTNVGSTCGRVQLGINLLGNNSMYLMRVKVSDPITKRFSFALQVIEITDGGPPILRITCILNCNIKVNPRTVIAFKVEQTNENGDVISANTSSITYSWSLLQSQLIRSLNGSIFEQFLVVNNFTNMTATGTNRPSVVIQPYALKPGFKYHVRVEGMVPGLNVGLTEVEIKTNLPPYGGSCDVQPKTGIAVTTRFTIACLDWKDEGVNVDRSVEISPSDYTLGYQVLYTTIPNTRYLLFSYGSNAVMPGRYLPPGLEEYNFGVWLQVRILDEYGEWAIKDLNITVYETKEVVEPEMLNNLTLSEISTSGSQNIAQFSATVSGVLNQVSNESQSLISSEVKMKIRSQLLTTVVDKINSDSDLDGIQQSCSVIGSLTQVSAEVDETSQLTAVNALSQRTELLSRLSETRSSEDVLETASVVAVGIDNVVKAARSQVVRNGEMASTNVVAVPLFSPPIYVEQSSTMALDYEEEFLSPEERVERRNRQQQKREEFFRKNQQLAMSVGNDALNSVTSLSKSMLKRKQPDEPSVMIKTNGLSMESEKNSMTDFCNRINTTKPEARGNGTTNSLRSLLGGSNVNLPGCDNSTNSDETIESELLTLAENPYIWDESADSVRSSVVSLTFSFPNGTKPFSQSSNSTFRLEIPVDSSFNEINAESFSFTPSGVDKMSYHELNVRKHEDILFLKIQPMDDNIRIRIYFLHTTSLKQFPSVDNYTFVEELPNYENNPENWFRLRLEGSRLELGRYVFGILQIDEIGNITSDENRTLSNYTLFNFVTSCQFWNETTNKWETTGCIVSDETTEKIVVCMCNHLTSFGADFLVAPNPIDFSAIAEKLANLKDNLAVLLTLIGMFVLYVIGVFFCRRQDKKDVTKWAVGLLVDNKLSDEYFYQVIVTTGGHRNAETTSTIYFVLFGENERTGLRMLKTNAKENRFKRGSVRKFLLTCDQALGKLTDLKIWHDNTGKENLCSWYLQHITVVDLQSKQRSFFFCDDWLAVDQSDGQIERLLPVADDNQIKSFRHLFTSSTKKEFSNGHLWFSLFSRPTKSNFTRVQRLSCALAILFSTMLSSAMFFGKDEEDQGKDGRLEIGPISFTVQQLIISIEASLIVIPINILLVEMFRRILPKKTKEVENFSSVSESLNSKIQTASNVNLEEKKKTESKLMLPHWMVYVTWSLVFLVCGISFTFVFLYSVEWGAEKANDWLLTILFSFVQSVFIIQPAKVVLVSIVVSFVVNKCFAHKASEMLDQDEEDAHGRQEDLKEFQKNEEEWLMQTPLEDDFEQMSKENVLPSKYELERVRIAREQHRLMIEAIYDIASYLLYVVLLLVAANSSKDINAFNFHDSLSDVFLKAGDPVLEEVRTIDDFWLWCDETLISGLHAPNWYNGDRITWRQTRYISNRETFVTGPARIRQLRVKKGECVITTNTSLVTRDCVKEYSILSQENENFGAGWIKNMSSKNISSYWTFQDFIDLGGYPYQGKMNLYDGGGYQVTLSSTAKKSRTILKHLNELKWIDRQTAAVFIEFSVYNANINLFASVVFLLERSPNGAFFANPVISPIRLYEFIDGTGYVLIVIYIIFLIVLLFKLYHIIKLIKLQRRKFLHHFWNVIDLAGLILAFCAIALYAVRFIYAEYVLNKIQEDYNKETFVNFQYLTLWNDTFRYLLAFTLFLATLKFTKLLTFNRRIRLLACTLKHASKPVGWFSVMFSIYFVAFMFLSNLWFEQKMYEYSSPYLAIEEMFSMLLGRFDFTVMQNSDPLLGPIFFCMFTGICTIALLNMFIVILDDSIKKARADMERQKNEFEVMDYLSKQIINYFSSLAPKFHQNADFTKESKKEKIMVDLLEDKVNDLTVFVSKLELQYYNSVSVVELEDELYEYNETPSTS